MNMLSLCNRPVPPTNWTTWTTIPWNEPGFSARMLENHLSQDHDWASRTSGIIEAQVAHIHSLLPQGANILDMGCGPGLYTERLSRLGHQCTGVDFSPASIEYAQKQPGAGHINYIFQDIREFQSTETFDAVLLLFGEINVFSCAEALRLLQTARNSLRPGGVVIVETHTAEAIRAIGHLPNHWQAVPSGLFSERPHLLLEEHFWNEALAAAMTRYYVLDAETAACTEYAALMQAYTEAEYQRFFEESGFTAIEPVAAADWPTGGAFTGKLQCVVCRV